MAVQSPTDRLLTEAAAATQAALVSSPLGAALKALLDPKLDDSQLGAPNGVAGLGADGRVPTAQLPPAAAVPTLSRITANVVTTTNPQDVAGLSAALSVGTWLVEASGLLTTTGTSAGLYLMPAGGLVAAPSAAASGASAAGASGRWIGSTGDTGNVNVRNIGWTADGATAFALNAAAVGGSWVFGTSLVLVVTTAGTLQLRVAATVGTTVAAHTLLRASKIA